MRICATAVSSKLVVDALPLIVSEELVIAASSKSKKSLDDFTNFSRNPYQEAVQTRRPNKAFEWGPSSILPRAEIDLHPRRRKAVLFPESVILLHIVDLNLKNDRSVSSPPAAMFC